VIFTHADYQMLHTLFSADYKGYRPTVRELPNGDGVVDADKRYLHVALKYDPPAWARSFLYAAHDEAVAYADKLGVPTEFWPDLSAGALRVLEYPIGAGSAMHTDFDLLTTLCYRSTPDDLISPVGAHLHIGEIGEIVGLGEATPHHVPGRPYVQHSIVYFALPAHQAVLPGGQTVGQWLANRLARSRVSATI
jgi:hypothetical protein